MYKRDKRGLAIKIHKSVFALLLSVMFIGLAYATTTITSDGVSSSGDLTVDGKIDATALNVFKSVGPASIQVGSKGFDTPNDKAALLLKDDDTNVSWVLGMRGETPFDNQLWLYSAQPNPSDPSSSVFNVPLRLTKDGYVRMERGVDIGLARPAGSSTRGLNIRDPARGTTFTNIQLAEDAWGGSHALLFNAYATPEAERIDGSLAAFNSADSTGNTKYVNDVGSFGSGAGMLHFIGNGGRFQLSISGPSSDKDTAINWGAPKLSVTRQGVIGLNNVLYLTPRSSPPVNPHPRTPTNTDPILGDIYVDDSGALCFYDGTDWQIAAGSATATCE